MTRLCTLIVMGVSGLLGGCNLIGAAAAIVHGPEKIPKVYELPRERSIVIVVDDRTNVVPLRAVRDTIAATAERAVMDQHLVKEVIASNAASAVLARERFGAPLTIDEIGKAVGADLVVYVAMDKFSLSEDGQMMTPLAMGRVRVVDARTGTRLSPPEGGPVETHPLAVRLPAQSTPPPKGAADLLAAQQDLARITGVAIAQMFYDAEQGDTRPNRLKDK